MHTLISIFKGYFLWVWYYLYKPYRLKRQKQAQERMDICRSCSHLTPHTIQCDICLCFMEIKTKMPFRLDENGKSIYGCALKKW